ncbi:MAG: ABC transporter substrate-binding protein [Clostridiaceae bacterium]|nr:ABC transporter substrate-binding protein [Clostridiaceae bacterium]
MKDKVKKIVAAFLAVSMAGSLVGCNESKKEPRPTPKATTNVDSGNTNATGQGEGQSDEPLVIGCSEFTQNYNPFVSGNDADKQVVELTQIKLFGTDRSGRMVYKGIDGELRSYNDTNYTYYGAADLTIDYNEKKDETTYRIELRDDLTFSDGEKITMDDILFSMYVLCDNSYDGDLALGDMPIKGLLNYQANNSKAEKISDKRVARYIEKMPSRLQQWIQDNIIEKEISDGMKYCRKNYSSQGYSSAQEYFQEKYQISGKGLTEKQCVKKAAAVYQKRGYRVLAKTVYQDKTYYDGQVEAQCRIFLAAGKGKKVKSISGIRQVGEYELEITTYGYNRSMSAALQIPVCALHYYGDTTLFSPEKGKFGFRRGDISTVCSHKAWPMGAGAYRFVKYEDGVVYLTSNEMYYLGCPEIAFVQLKEMNDVLKETREQLALAAQEEEKTSRTQQDDETTEMPIETAAPVAEAVELKEGTVDVISGNFSNEDLLYISSLNSGGTLSGNVVDTQFIGEGEYQYIGIHAGNVKVNGKKSEKKSKYLRTALATVFSAAKETLLEEKYHSVGILEYPVCSNSWVAPSKEDADYEEAYAKDLTGELIYENTEGEEKMPAACQAALQYLKAAGYQIEGNKAVKAPKGASLQYTILVPGGSENDLYSVVQSAAEALKTIGIRIKVKKVCTTEALNRILQKGSQQLWVGTRDLEDMDFADRYTSGAEKNIFGIQDKKLDRCAARLEKLLSSEVRQQTYRKCFERLMEQAVEVPVCETRKIVLFSSSRIDSSTIPDDITQYYSWMDVIQKMKMD